MTGYVLSDEAEQDFDDIVSFVAADSLQGARKVLDDIDRALMRLGDMPHIGHVRPDLAEDDVRFWVVHSYLIVYRAELQPIHILRIVSGFRDLVGVLR